jgi:hypothetical protein
MFRILRKYGFLISIIAGSVTIIAGALSLKRSCEPHGLSECLAEFRKWSQAKEDAEAAAERIRAKNEEQLNRDIQKRADEAERVRLREQDLRRAIAEEQLRKDLENARIEAATKIAIEQAKLDQQLRELKAAEEKHKNDLKEAEDKRQRDLVAARKAQERKQLEEDERIALQDAERRRKQLEDQRIREEEDRRRQRQLREAELTAKRQWCEDCCSRALSGQTYAMGSCVSFCLSGGLHSTGYAHCRSR